MSNRTIPMKATSKKVPSKAVPAKTAVKVAPKPPVPTKSPVKATAKVAAPKPVPTKSPVKASAKKAVVLKKPVKKPVRLAEPDPSDDVFSIMDNILDTKDLEAEYEDASDSDDIKEAKEALICLTEFRPTVTNEDISSVVPYFNVDEKLLYTSPEYDIQNCMTFISSLMTNFMNDGRKTIVTESKILSLLNNISVGTAAFWAELAWSKDIISYKLNQRNFPTFTLIEKETTSEVTVDDVQDQIDAPKKDSENPEDPSENHPSEVSNSEEFSESHDNVTDLIALNETPNKKSKKHYGEKIYRSNDPDRSYKKGKKWNDKADPNLPPTDKQETEGVIRKKYDLGRPGTLQSVLDQAYVDEGVTVTDSGVRHYNVLQQEKYFSTINNDTVIHIFNMANESRAYSIMLSLFCRLAVSREFAHLALSTPIVNMMFTAGTPFNDPEYLEIIHHSMFYGFYLLYKEECTIKSMANATHRCVLDLETVQRFPVYDGPLSENPYIPLTLSNKYLYAETVPTEQYLFKPLRVSNTERGVYTIHSSQERFDIFTDGVFRGISWDKLSMTGSLLPACVIRNPLEKMFGINLPMTTDLNDPDAARAYWQNPVNRTNVQNYFDEYYPSKNVLHSGYLDPNDTTRNLDHATDKMSDIDIIVDLGDDRDFDRKVLEVFEVVKTNAIRNNLENPTKYPSAEVKMLKITTPNSYKYYIVGPALHKNIELFRIFVHPLGSVSRFHFPCVRGTYHGDSIKLFPSMISSAFTGILLEYKWMSSAKNTKDLVCKYWQRGFTLILNQVEHEAMHQHILENEAQWGYLMAANDNERSISMMNPIFKPRQNRTGIYGELSNLDLKPPPQYKYVLPMANFDKYWVSNEKKSIYGFNLDLRFPAGHIKPPQLWTLGPYLEKLISSEKYN